MNSLQRRYMYLPPELWAKLYSAAKQHDTNISTIIKMSLTALEANKNDQTAK